MAILRTPDECFADLPGYPFTPNYLQVTDSRGQDLRIHYVDEGDKSAPVVLMLHGEPSWSYLYRKMIPIVVAAGYRAVAPDLIGFGKSDKLDDRNDYSYAAHLEWLQAWLDAMQLNDMTLVCQDWGGLLGLRLVTAQPEKFARVVTANTTLPTGDNAPNQAFLDWQNFSQAIESFPTGGIIEGATVSHLSDDIRAAYDAPYPEEQYKEGARQFPLLVPTTPDDPESQNNRDAWKVLKQFDKPWLCAFSDQDPVMAGLDEVFKKMVPGCAGQPHTTIMDGGHFLQEDKGEELAEVVVSFMQAT